MLQPEQLAEIDLAVERRLGRLRHALGDQLVEPLFLELHLQLFVEAVGDLRLDAARAGRSLVKSPLVDGTGAGFDDRYVTAWDKLACDVEWWTFPVSAPCRGQAHFTLN